jgi:hypothetical protein
MTLPVRLATFSLSLLLANCVGAPDDLMDAPENVAQEQQPLFYGTTTTVRCTPAWGTVDVTVHHDGQYGDGFDPCALFDGILGLPAVITYNGASTLQLDMRFGEKKKLSGFLTQVGGYDDHPSGTWISMWPSCAEGPMSSGDYGLYASKPSVVSFESPCTTDTISFLITRNDNDGVEHIGELAPVFVDAGTPITGDRITLLTNPSVARCGQPEKLQAADILPTSSGTPVGRIQLWRAHCTRPGTSTPVDVYYARSVSSVGVPANMDHMSTFIRYTDAWGSYRVNKTITTHHNPANGVVESNVFATGPNGAALTVSACGRFYPDVLSQTPDATAAGCTAAFTLP